MSDTINAVPLTWTTGESNWSLNVWFNIREPYSQFVWRQLPRSTVCKIIRTWHVYVAVWGMRTCQRSAYDVSVNNSFQIKIFSVYIAPSWSHFTLLRSDFRCLSLYLNELCEMGTGFVMQMLEAADILRCEYTMNGWRKKNKHSYWASVFV